MIALSLVLVEILKTLKFLKVIKPYNFINGMTFFCDISVF